MGGAMAAFCGLDLVVSGNYNYNWALLVLYIKLLLSHAPFDLYPSVLSI